MTQKLFLVWFHLLSINRQKCYVTPLFSFLQMVELGVYYG